MRKSLVASNKVTFSEMLLKTGSVELGTRRAYLKTEYGFTKEETNYIAR